MKGKGRASFGVVAIAIAAFGWASPARGDEPLGVENGLSYISDSQPVLTGQAAAPTADCPEGQSVVGGGGDAVAEQEGGVLGSLAPSDGPDADTKLDDAFTASGFNSTLQASSTIVWAICAPGTMRYRKETKPLKQNRTVAVRAECPKGTNVTGGGAFATGPTDETFLNMTVPWDSADDGKILDNGWKVQATNLGGATKDLTAYAICRAELDSRPFLALGVFTGEEGGFVANCKNDKFSVSGAGGRIKGDGSLVHISAVYPRDVADTKEPEGPVPDDSVVMEGENMTGQFADGGPAGICLR